MNYKFMNRNLIKKIDDMAFAVIICIVLATINLDWIIFLVNKRMPFLSINGFASVSDKIFFATFLALIWYAWETKNMRKQMECQSELQSMPILAIYVRNIKDINNESKKEHIKNNFAVTREIIQDNKPMIVPSEYYLVIRNMGKGPALDTKVESENFLVKKYATNIIAPNTDEQPFKVVQRGANGTGKKMRAIAVFNGTIFRVFCKSMEKIEYSFEYEIIDFVNNEIKYRGYKTDF